MALAPTRPPGRSVKNLRMVWSFAAQYRLQLACAALALFLAAAATSGVPFAFKLIIDKGFGSGAGGTRDIARWFEYLLLLVGIMVDPRASSSTMICVKTWRVMSSPDLASTTSNSLPSRTISAKRSNVMYAELSVS